MAKNLTTFFGNFLSSPVNINAADDPQSDFFFKPRANNGLNGMHNIACQGVANPSNARYARFFRHEWTVPAGVSTATFHAWGGGGSGAESKECQSGVGGGSGAYAYKSVSVSPGSKYVLCFSGVERHCCTREFCSDGTTNVTGQPIGYISKGNRGMTAFVTGDGLTNFCAEGGNPGVAKCCGWMSSSHRPFGFNSTLNACYACKLIKVCDAIGRCVHDSANEVYRAGNYYGADGGSKGIYACHRTSCCGGQTHDATRCGDRIYIPYPGGLLKTGYFGHIERPSVNGGVVEIKNCSIHHDMHGAVTCRAQAFSGFAAGGGPNPLVVGMGGMTANTCGGTCCCGQFGGPGMIRISYS
jgi:hypothetical protein